MFGCVWKWGFNTDRQKCWWNWAHWVLQLHMGKKRLGNHKIDSWRSKNNLGPERGISLAAIPVPGTFLCWGGNWSNLQLESFCWMNWSSASFCEKTLELFRVYWNQQGSLVQEFYPKKVRSYHILPMFMEGWQLPWQVPKTIRTSTSSEGSSTSPALQVARKDEAEPAGLSAETVVFLSWNLALGDEFLKLLSLDASIPMFENPHVWGLKLLNLMVASLFLPDDPPILAGYILKI